MTMRVGTRAKKIKADHRSATRRVVDRHLGRAQEPQQEIVKRRSTIVIQPCQRREIALSNTLSEYKLSCWQKSLVGAISPHGYSHRFDTQVPGDEKSTQKRVQKTRSTRPEYEFNSSGEDTASMFTYVIKFGDGDGKRVYALV